MSGSNEGCAVRPGAVPGGTSEGVIIAEVIPEPGPCPECNGSLYVTRFGIDGPRIVGCYYCKGTGLE